MAGGYGKALAVMVIATFAVAAFYAAVAPALGPLLETIASDPSVQSGDSPVGVGIINDISFILFILGPMILLLAAYLLPLAIGLRREVFFGRR